MTVFLLILSILLGNLWMFFPEKEIHPFATDMSISSLWYINLLCYKLRFVLLVGALMINLKGLTKMIASIFLTFYVLNLLEYLIVYDSSYPLAGIIVKSLISVILILVVRYAKRNSTLDYYN